MLVATSPRAAPPVQDSLVSDGEEGLISVAYAGRVEATDATQLQRAFSSVG